MSSHTGSRFSRFASTEASSSRARKRRRRIRKPRSWVRKNSIASLLAPAPFLPEIRSSPRARASVHIAMRRLMTRSEEHTSELQSLMRISYAVFCLKKKKKHKRKQQNNIQQKTNTLQG